MLVLRATTRWSSDYTVTTMDSPEYPDDFNRYLQISARNSDVTGLIVNDVMFSVAYSSAKWKSLANDTFSTTTVEVENGTYRIRF